MYIFVSINKLVAFIIKFIKATSLFIETNMYINVT